MRLPVLTVLFVAFAGCAQTNPHLGLVTDAELQSPPPFDALAERLAEARQLDPSLKLGFYTLPDFAGPFETTSDAFYQGTPLLNRLQLDVAPESWEEPGRTAFQYGSWLVVIHSGEVLAQITPWVEQACGDAVAPHDVVHTRLFLIQVRDLDELLQDVLGEFDFSSNDNAPQRVFVLTPKQQKELLAYPGIKVSMSPRMTVSSGRKAKFWSEQQVAYVPDYRHYYVNGHDVLDPVVRVLESGVHIDLVATLTPDGSRCAMRLDLSLSEYLGMRDEEVERVGQRVTVQYPEVQTASARAEFSQAVGSSCLWVDADDSRWVVVSAVDVRP